MIKAHSFGLSERDLEKIDSIRRKEQISSRSETIRRIIDFYFRADIDDQKNAMNHKGGAL